MSLALWRTSSRLKGLFDSGFSRPTISCIMPTLHHRWQDAMAVFVGLQRLGLECNPVVRIKHVLFQDLAPH